jgi:predicted ATP-dependent endonuclease of OLD family
MHITSMRIENYKSYHDSGEIPLTNGFNVIVGANNAGKTAFVETLNYNEDRFYRLSNPHISPLIHPKSKQKISSLKLTIEISGQEIKELLQNKQADSKNPAEFKDFAFPIYTQTNTYEEDILSFFANDKIKIRFISSVMNNGLEAIDIPLSFGLLATQNLIEIAFFRFDEDGGVKVFSRISPDAREAKNVGFFLNHIAPFVVRSLYFIQSERFGFSSSRYENNILSSDISQLPTALRLLQDKPARWNRYQAMVKQVLPEVERLTTPEDMVPVPNDTKTERRVYIKLWSKEAIENDREDLAFSLFHSGTGVGQILALLYVVMVSKSPKTLILEEPQSFLHPRALRKLFEILKQNPQHQYIITTHSPNVITAADPDTILLVEKIGSESSVTPISRRQKHDMARVLESVGASLSDVFGADYILWVEGQTEEECFPLIIRKLGKHKDRLLDTEILRLRTGHFDAKPQSKIDVVIDTYKTLSEGTTLRPPAIGFIFDRETRSPEKMKQWKEKSNDMIAFLDRRMYENYLLHSGAIAAILSRDTNSSISSEDIAAWFIKNRVNSDDVDMDAVDKLNQLFNELGKCNYKANKVAYGYDLTKWILENEPEYLQELANFLDELIGRWSTKINT